MSDGAARNFRLSFERRAGLQEYDLTAEVDGEVVATSTFVVPFTHDEMRQKLADLERTRSADAHGRTPGADALRVAEAVPSGRQDDIAEEFGTVLADALFSGPVGEAFAGVAKPTTDVQIRLTMTEEQTELLTIPWEFLCRDGIFLASQPQTPVLRELWTGSTEPVEPHRGRLRILAVSASPAGHEQLNTELEKQAIADVVAKHGELAELEWIDDCTYDQIHDALRRDPHVFHFVGHSTCDDDGNAAFLLCHADRSEHRVSALAFANLLNRARSLRLVVLNSCEGGRAVAGEAYASLAQKLARLGRSAVVAMQFKITDPAAIAFSAELYERLIAERSSIDRAVSEGRAAIMGKNELEFATPVLYLCDGITDLFPSRPSGSTVDAPAVGPDRSPTSDRAVPRDTGRRLGERLLHVATPPAPRLIGDDVFDLQRRLAALGSDAGPLDGAYGPMTAQAVAEFQGRVGIAVDGVCGPLTVAALERVEADPTAVASTPPDDTPSTGGDRARDGWRPARRHLLAGGIAALVIAVVLGAVFTGDDGSTDAPANTSPATTAAVTVAAVTSVAVTSDAPPSDAMSAPAPTTLPEVEPENTVLAAEELFGLVVDYPRLPSIPVYAVPTTASSTAEFADDCAALDWAREFGAMVSEGESRPTVSVTLQATSRLRSSGATVAITGMTVDVVAWAPPVDGVLVSCQGLPLTDASAPVRVEVALPGDERTAPTLAFRRVDVDEPSGETARTEVFPRQVLLPGETIFFDLEIDSAPCDCTWKLVLQMVIDGERQSIDVVRADGRPFRTSGSSNARPLFPTG